MRNSLFKIATIVLLQTFSTILLAHVELDYPVGGETLISGTTVNVQWHIAIAHNTLNWDLYYSPDSGVNWEPLQLGMPPGQLSYMWLVPSIPTTQGRVRIVQNNSSTDYLDVSMDFTIQLPVLLPAINLPASDTTIESDVVNQDDIILTWLNNHGGASATNFCGVINWTNDFDGLSIACGATGSALVTFTAADQCGSTMTSATLTIIDTADPILNASAVDLVVECDGNGNVPQLNTWLQNRGGANAYDAGGNVIWTNNYSALSNGCGTTGNTSVTFMATDPCGNSISTIATFAIEDTTLPGIIDVAHDTIVDCETPNKAILIQRWLSNHGGAKANDICGNVSWTNNFPVLSDTCVAEGSYIITFTASDECGPSIVFNANFSILGTSGTSTPKSTDPVFKIFPNPVHDALKLEMEKNESQFVGLTLYDAFGKALWFYNGSAKQVSIPVSTYSSGIYFIAVRTAAGTFVRKVLIE